MGNVGRTIYLVFPFLLTLVSLILLVIVLLNLTSATSNSFLASLYFVRVDAGNVSAKIAGKAVSISGVAGFYDIGLFRYCTGDKGAALPNFCSDSTFGFTFDLIDVFRKSNIPNLGSATDKEWTAAMSAYRAVSKFLCAAYIIGFGFSVLSLLFGLLTFCLSRVTNMFTTIASGIGSLFIVLAAVAGTAIFSTMRLALYNNLHQYNVDVKIGSLVIVISWLAAAGSLIATFFWSCGCCCGRDRSHDGGRHHAKSGFKGQEYERLHDPHSQNVTVQNITTPYASHGYEPYRGHSAV